MFRAVGTAAVLLLAAAALCSVIFRGEAEALRSALVDTADAYSSHRWFFVVFAAVCTLLCGFGVPRMWIAASAVVLLDPWPAFAASMFASVAGASVTYFLAKIGSLEKQAVSGGRTRDMFWRLGRVRGIPAVILVRQLPVPGVFSSVYMSVTGTGFRDFAIGSAVGFLPSTVLIVFAGELALRGSGTADIVSAVAMSAVSAAVIIFLKNKAGAEGWPEGAEGRGRRSLLQKKRMCARFPAEKVNEGPAAPNERTPEMPKPIAVQLYSLREYSKTRDDFINVIKRVADIGYKAVEPAGFHDIPCREFRRIIDDLGLEMYSSHSPWAHSPDDCSKIIDDLGELRLDKCVCGYSAAEFKDMDSIKRTAENTNLMLEKFKAAGITLFQHNHAFEFERIDGRLKYEIYAELCPEVKFEIDSFWSTNIGVENAVDMMRLFSDRMILIHIKDGALHQKDAEQKYVNGILDRKISLLPLGQGELPIRELVLELPEQVSSIVVELDYCEVEMWKAIEESYRFMVSHGYASGNK